MTAIEVFSTYALDRFIRNGIVLKESPGGPALFIDQTLVDLQIPHRINAPSQVLVKILLTDSGEFGRIPVPPQKDSITRTGSITVISTLLNDWKIIAGVSPIYLDIQGYVRDGSDFGKKKGWKLPSHLWPQIECIKGTEEEISFLGSNFVNDQKSNRQLIITRGASGVSIFTRGLQFYVGAESIENLPNTVGAGDTWFAAYVARQANGYNPHESAEFASKYVAKFLKKKI